MSHIRKPKIKKILIFDKFAKFLIQHKKILSGIILLLSFGISFGIFLIIFVPKPQTASVPSKPNRYSNPTVINEAAELKLQESSPSSGPLQYEKVATYFAVGSSSPKFIYFTSERRDNRLIELTDQIIAELKINGQITEQTNSYTIAYFNDKTVASTYFPKVSDPKITTDERLKLKVNYIATMAYVKSFGFSQLIRVSTAKIIKSF